MHPHNMLAENEMNTAGQVISAVVFLNVARAVGTFYSWQLVLREGAQKKREEKNLTM